MKMGLLAQLQGGPDASLVPPGGVSITLWGFWVISVVKLQRFGERGQLDGKPLVLSWLP